MIKNTFKILFAIFILSVAGGLDTGHMQLNTAISIMGIILIGIAIKAYAIKRNERK